MVAKAVVVQGINPLGCTGGVVAKRVVVPVGPTRGICYVVCFIVQVVVLVVVGVRKVRVRLVVRAAKAVTEWFGLAGKPTNP